MKKKLIMLLFFCLLVLLVGCVEKPQYSIKFLNYDGTLLYECIVKEGDIPIYNGDIPNRDGYGRESYEFSGWSPSLKKVYGDSVYTATFEIVKLPYEPDQYDGISKKEELIQHILNYGKKKDVLLNGSEREEYYIILSGSYYFSYIPSLDLFKIAYGGRTVMVVYFYYQNINNCYYGFIGSSYTNYTPINSVKVEYHEFISCDISSASDYIKKAIEYANDYTTKKGFGYLTDYVEK